MTLRGISPEKIDKRLKLFLYGEAGVGKTMAAIQFPKPYLIDTERGAENEEYIKLLKKNEGAIFQTADFDELLKEVRSLLSETHPYKTLIIDPLTMVYNNLLEESAEKLRLADPSKDATGTEFGRHYGEANKQMKHLVNLLLRLDMNVVITSHAKREYGDKLVVLGNTFDCYKKIDYLFDLVIEIKKVGKERVGIIKKSRIKSFDETEQFPFTYNNIADKYGRSVIEKDVQPQILASKEQISEINHLINTFKVESTVISKWLKKANAVSFEEITEETASSIIKWFNDKIKQTDNEVRK